MHESTEDTEHESHNTSNGTGNKQIMSVPSKWYRSFIEDNWYTEEWGTYGMRIKIHEVIHEEKTPYQNITVLKSVDFGNMLLLDGIMQCSEEDEFVYQEMLAHVPLNCHPNPEKVLIIGGGDGGVLREVVKHPLVKSVVLCEIDKRVIEISQKYFPTMASAIDHPKAVVAIEDGNQYVKDHQNEFDVIIMDCSDPIGPNQVLFQTEHHRRVSTSLKDGGILCCQGESVWIDADEISERIKMMQSLFPVVRYGSCCMPTYPTGQIGVLVASKSKDTKFETPLRELTEQDIKDSHLRYYSTKVHEAAFVLPLFAQNLLYGEDS